LDGALVFELAFAAAGDFFEAAVAFERVAFFTGIDGSSFAKAATRGLQQRRCPVRAQRRVV
jgi:hypothetical protein